MTEQQLQERIIDLARLRGWRVHHTRPARTEKGWRTPVEGDRGFPDLVLARRGAVIIAELKSSDTGPLGPGQREWLDELGDHGHLWRPADWPQIVAVLETRGA